MEQQGPNVPLYLTVDSGAHTLLPVTSSQLIPPRTSSSECLRRSVSRWSFPSTKLDRPHKAILPAGHNEYDASPDSSIVMSSPRWGGGGDPSSVSHHQNRSTAVRKRVLSMQATSSTSSVIDGRYSPAVTSIFASMDDPVLEVTAATSAQRGGRGGGGGGHGYLPSMLLAVPSRKPAPPPHASSHVATSSLSVLPQTSRPNTSHNPSESILRRREASARIRRNDAVVEGVPTPYSPRTLQNSSASLHHRNRATLPETIVREQTVSRRQPTRPAHHRQLVVRDDLAVEADADYPIASIPFLSTRDAGEVVRWNRSAGHHHNQHASAAEVDADNTAPFDVGGVSWSEQSTARTGGGGGPNRRGQRRDPKRLMDVSPTRRTGRVVFLDPGLGGLLFDTVSIFMVRFNLEDLVLQSMTILALGDVLSYNRVQEGADAYRAVRLVRVSTREEDDAKKRSDTTTTTNDEEADDFFAAVPQQFSKNSIASPDALSGGGGGEGGASLAKKKGDGHHSPKRPSILTGIEYRAFLSRKRQDTNADSLLHPRSDDESDGGEGETRPDDVVNAFGRHSSRRSTRKPIDLVAASDSVAVVSGKNTVDHQTRSDDEEEVRLLGKKMMQLSRTNPEWLLDEVEREFDDEVHHSIRRAAAAAAAGRRQGGGGADVGGPVSLYDLNESRATDAAVRHFMEISEVPVAEECAALEKRRREYRWYASDTWPQDRDRRFQNSGNVFERLTTGGRAGGRYGGGGNEDVVVNEDPDELGAPDASPNASDAYSDSNEDPSPTHSHAAGGGGGRHFPPHSHHHPRKQSSTGGVAEVTRAFEKERRQIAQVNVRKFVDGVDLEPSGVVEKLNYHQRNKVMEADIPDTLSMSGRRHVYLSKQKEDRPSPRVWK